MRVTVCSVKTVKTVVTAVLCATVAVLLLCFPQAAGNGVRRGLAMCAELLVPSLFPFLVLSGFVIRSGMVSGLGRVLAPLMRRVFGFSGSAAAAMIISLIGGYPAGANAVAQLCEQGEIGHDEAVRLLRCCVSAGPAFIIGGVGAGMLGSASAGVWLLIAHWLSFLIVALFERGTPPAERPVTVAGLTVGAAVADSVQAAAQSMISMCGFVVLCSAGLSLADALGASAIDSPVWRCLAMCATEVSGGCVEAAGMGRTAPFWLGAALGFGGLSVHGQIASRTASLGLMDRGFFRARLVQALLGGALSALLLWWWHPAAASAGATVSAFAPENTAAGVGGLTALMLMCVLYLHTLSGRRFCA